MGFLQNIKHVTNRNSHSALDQYVSPKNSIKSCQKYMKVEEYWHGTIKNYRYDGDVSAVMTRHITKPTPLPAVVNWPRSWTGRSNHHFTGMLVEALSPLS